MKIDLGKFDHPLFFLFFLFLALTGISALATYGFKALGWPGPAALVQHP